MNKAKPIFRKIILLYSLLYLGSCKGKHDNSSASIAFYNCENFFDTSFDEFASNNDFTPTGKNHYTQKVYEQKLHNIATVIQSFGSLADKKLPALIGLAEVEDSEVLADLVRQPEIARSNYQFIITHGCDTRGINVGLLYNPEHFKAIFKEELIIDCKGIPLLTRNILHVAGVLNEDTINIFVNHWPSRKNSRITVAGNERILAADVLREKLDSMLQKNANAKIIVMGDFNDNPTDSSISAIVGISGFYNPFTEIYRSGGGTEYYAGEWNLFDQIIFSKPFTNNKTGLRYKSAEIYNPPFITKGVGKKAIPFRSYLGNRFMNGYGDHFPVLVYLAGE